MRIRYFPNGTYLNVVRGSVKALEIHDSRRVRYGSAGDIRATALEVRMGSPRTFTETVEVFKLAMIRRDPTSLEFNSNPSGVSAREPMAKLRIRPGKGNVKE